MSFKAPANFFSSFSCPLNKTKQNKREKRGKFKDVRIRKQKRWKGLIKRNEEMREIKKANPQKCRKPHKLTSALCCKGIDYFFMPFLLEYVFLFLV